MTTHTDVSTETVPAGPLVGRTAIVTGASSGIGAATVRTLAAGGAQVAALARRADRLTALQAEAGPERVLALPADVTDPAALDTAAARLADRFGAADLVIAAAGVMLPAPVAELRSDEWRQMIELNLVGVLQTMRAFLPGLREAAAAARTADLVIVSSIGARVTFPGYAVYGATKAAVSYLAEAWRQELAPSGIRVTVVEPGLTATELAGHVTHDRLAGELAGMFETIPALTPEDVAEAIVHVAGLPARASIPTVPVLPARQA